MNSVLIHWIHGASISEARQDIQKAIQGLLLMSMEPRLRKRRSCNSRSLLGWVFFGKQRHHDPSLRPWNVASWTIDENPPLVDDFPSYKRPYLQTISCHVGLLDSNWGSDLEQVFLSIFNGKTLGLTECHSGHRSACVVVWCKLLDFGLDSGNHFERQFSRTSPL
jgi:hypothetical protein